METDETKTVETAETSTEKTEETKTDAAETTADPLDAITDPDELRKAAKAQRSIAQRYKRQPPKELPNPVPKVDDSIVQRVDRIELSEKKRQFGYKHQLSPDETDKLFKFAGNDKPEEAIKDPFFQSALTAFRKEQSVKSAIPSSSNSTTFFEGKSFKEMTHEERAKNWSKITGQ
jgi:hypothetical protein